MKDVPIVKAGMAYDAPWGETYILVLAQSLYLGEYVPNSLLCPNQMRCHGIVVDDVPKHLAPDPAQATHSLYFADKDIRIPLELEGCISQIPTRLPTVQELEECEWLTLTGDAEWDPHASSFAENERLISEADAYIRPDRSIFALQSNFECEISQVLSSYATTLCDHGLHQAMLENPPLITYEQAHTMSVTSSTISKGQKSMLTKEELAHKWKIGLEASSQTLCVTTQKGIRNAIHPVLRRF
jgi:hypothetical protein